MRLTSDGRWDLMDAGRGIFISHHDTSGRGEIILARLASLLSSTAGLPDFDMARLIATRHGFRVLTYV